MKLRSADACLAAPTGDFRRRGGNLVKVVLYSRLQRWMMTFPIPPSKTHKNMVRDRNVLEFEKTKQSPRPLPESCSSDG